MDSFLSRLCEDKGIVLSEDVSTIKPTKPTKKKGKNKKLTLDNNKDKDK